MTFSIYIEIFCWRNAQPILYLSTLTKTVNTVDFLETQHKAQALRKNSMNFKKITLLECLKCTSVFGLVKIWGC